MKKLVLLLGALALIGCGEKNESGAGAVEAADSSADSQVAPNQTEAPSGDSAELADNGITLPLSDADFAQILKLAVDLDVDLGVDTYISIGATRAKLVRFKGAVLFSVGCGE